MDHVVWSTGTGLLARPTLRRTFLKGMTERRTHLDAPWAALDHSSVEFQYSDKPGVRILESWPPCTALPLWQGVGDVQYTTVDVDVWWLCLAVCFSFLSRHQDRPALCDDYHRLV